MFLQACSFLLRLLTATYLHRTCDADIFEFVDVNWPPAKGTTTVDFELSTDFPKRVFSREEVKNSGATLGDEQLGPQQLFMIQQV